MHARRDPEAVAAYRSLLKQHGCDTKGMSDEIVIEQIERTFNAILDIGRNLRAAIEQMRAPMLRAVRAFGDLYPSLAGPVLADEAEMDLRLRDMDLDARLLALFDEEQ